MGVKLNASGMGGELSYASTTYIEPDAQIRCLHDYLIVEPLNIEHSLILDVIEDIRPVRGVVKAIGPGVYPNVYDHPEKHRRTKMWKSKVFLPTQVKVGDVVELGSIRVDGKMVGYSFQQIMIGSKMHIVCREQDVSGIVTNEQEAA